MTLSGPPLGQPTTPVISLASNTALMRGFTHTANGGVSQAWPLANRAHLYPFYISQARTYQKAFWLNGATAAGNVDVGIYTWSGTTATRVVASTAEAQAGVSAMQIPATFASTTLQRGWYLMAISASLATATFWTSATSYPTLRGQMFQIDTAHPLPASGTLLSITNSIHPQFGFSELTTL